MATRNPSELANTFAHVMSLYGLQVGTDAGQVYIDFYSYGGGYKIETKNFHNSGINEPFGGVRRSRKEFMAFLAGLRQAKIFEYEREQDAKSNRTRFVVVAK